MRADQVNTYVCDDKSRPGRVSCAQKLSDQCFSMLFRSLATMEALIDGSAWPIGIQAGVAPCFQDFPSHRRLIYIYIYIYISIAKDEASCEDRRKHIH